MTPRKSIEKSVMKQIKALCKKGDLAAEAGEFEGALDLYKQALRLVPMPLEEWEATTWIIAAIGDARFLQGAFGGAAEAFEDAVRCPAGLGNEFIHLRIGQCKFELGDLDRAADELTRAYMGGGLEIFDREDPKYLEFLRTKIRME